MTGKREKVEGKKTEDEEKGRVRRIRGLILFAGLVCLGVIYSKEVFRIFKGLIAMTSPFLVGAAIAFVLNLPMRFIEEKILRCWKNKKTAGLKRGVSLLLAILSIIFVLAFVIGMVVPRLLQTLLEGPFCDERLYNNRFQPVS